ncbi:MAG: KH domain-containing protein [Clostridia bacterium]|nr:KH domain-containing protein [Clostridia bacterium]
MISYKDLLEDMARAIVEHPDEVKVTESEDDKEITLTLNVAEGDMGMVIGKHGNIAKAMRTVVKAAGKLDDKVVKVDIR